MNNYKLRMNTRAGSPSWEWEFTSRDDSDATLQVISVLESDFADINWIMSFDLFTTSTKDGMVTFNYERHVANLRIGTPTIDVRSAR